VLGVEGHEGYEGQWLPRNFSTENSFGIPGKLNAVLGAAEERLGLELRSATRYAPCSLRADDVSAVVAALNTRYGLDCSASG
jgi:hypothetical protein